MDRLLRLSIVIVSMMCGQIFIGYFSVVELGSRILLKEHGQLGQIAWGFMTILLLIFTAQLMIFFRRWIKTENEIQITMYLYASVIYNFTFMFYQLHQYFSGNQVDLSLALAVIITILQLMLIPLSYEHQKLSKEENFYKRNLAFVNRAFMLPMGLRGSEGDGRERIQNNVIDDLPSLEI